MANLIDTDAKLIVERAEGYGHPSVVRTNADRLYTAHITVVDTLEVHYSDDNGENWTLDTTFSCPSGTSSIDMFSFAVSDLDDIFVTYSIAEGSDQYTLKVQKRDHTAGTWSEVLEETTITSENIILHPLVTWNRYESNRLHIFWLEHTPSASATIYNKYSDNYGSSWTSGTNKVLDDNTRTISSMDTDPTNGYVYLTEYITTSETYTHVYGFNSIGVYQSITDVEQSRDNFGAYIAINSTGIRWTILYGEKNNWYDGNLMKNETIGTRLFGNIYGAHSVKKGMFSLGIDSADNVYVFWTKPDEKAYYKKYDKETEIFGSETALTTGDGFRIGCEQHTFTGDSKLNVAYYIG